MRKNQALLKVFYKKNHAKDKSDGNISNMRESKLENFHYFEISLNKSQSQSLAKFHATITKKF